MKALFESIEHFFMFLFKPLDALRATESWWSSNTLNFIMIIICFIAFFYWMKQLKIFDASGEEDKDNTSHSFL